MEGILNSNSSLISIYTIWKPNGLDGMDDDHIDDADSDGTGQYITGFTREKGQVENQVLANRKSVFTPYFQEQRRAGGEQDGGIL